MGKIVMAHPFALSDLDLGILNIFLYVIDLVVLLILWAVAIIVGFVVSLFVCPYALRKHFKNPEKTILEGFWSN